MGESLQLTCRTARDTGRIEEIRGKQNSPRRGKIRRYGEEYQWRRQLSGIFLTLRLESVGIKTD
jgi:hypothetical protein